MNSFDVFVIKGFTVVKKVSIFSQKMVFFSWWGGAQKHFLCADADAHKKCPPPIKMLLYASVIALHIVQPRD